MKQILLTKGKFVLVDDEDFQWLNQWKWYYHTEGYAYRQKTIKKEVFTFMMHREILKHYNLLSDNLYIDHKNRNRLDNQKINLRLATNSQNQMNRKGLKGINLYRNGKWRASATLNQKHIHLGYFFTKEEALIAYNKFAIENFGQFANLNQIGGNI